MTVFSGVGASGTVSAASGGKVYAFNNISEASARVVANANPFRRRITFHNPGANDIYVAPAYVQNVVGTAPTQPSNVALTPSNAALGGCRIIYGNGGTLVVEGECQGGWQAFAKTGAGTTNPLTVEDSNV